MYSTWWNAMGRAEIHFSDSPDSHPKETSDKPKLRGILWSNGPVTVECQRQESQGERLRNCSSMFLGCIFLLLKVSVRTDGKTWIGSGNEMVVLLPEWHGVGPWFHWLFDGCASSGEPMWDSFSSSKHRDGNSRLPGLWWVNTVEMLSSMPSVAWGLTKNKPSTDNSFLWAGGELLCPQYNKIIKYLSWKEILGRFSDPASLFEAMSPERGRLGDSWVRAELGWEPRGGVRQIWWSWWYHILMMPWEPKAHL